MELKNIAKHWLTQYLFIVAVCILGMTAFANTMSEIFGEGVRTFLIFFCFICLAIATGNPVARLILWVRAKKNERGA